MFAREVKAFVNRDRAADVVEALNNLGFHHITAADVQGLSKDLSDRAQHYSVEVGQKVVNEVKLELVCDNDQRVADAVQAIRENARTGQPSAGWIFITDIRSAIEITD
jgi:nitrogen regulatory protein P-II 1